MRESLNEPDQSTISQNDIPLRVTRQQTQSALGMAAITRSLFQTNMISLGFLNDTSCSLILFEGLLQCHLSEIIKPNDPKANYRKMTESKYAGRRDLINKDTFRAVVRI